jgi:hypothetical protein
MKLKTVNIKGKEYVEVNTRIKYFRQHEAFKGFSLESDIIELTDESVLIKAVIKDANGRIIATGYAQEDKSSSYINKTSFIENCETSAWGRALGNLGIGIDSSVASYEEVDIAIKKQEAKQQPKKAAKLKLTDSGTHWDNTVNALKSGKVKTIEQIASYYEITPEAKKKLEVLIHAINTD